MGSPLDALAQAFGLPPGYFNSLFPFSLLQTTPVQQDRTPMSMPSTAPMPMRGPSMMGGQFSGPQNPQGLPPQIGPLPPSGIPSQSQMQMGGMPPMPGGPQGIPGGGMAPMPMPTPPAQFPQPGGMNPLMLIQALLGRGPQGPMG